MAARQDEADEERPASTTPTRTSETAAPAPAGRGDSEVHEVSLTQFRAQFPGLVSVAQGG